MTTLRSGGALLALLMAVSAAGARPASAETASSSPAVPANQVLAVLTSAAGAFAAPTSRSARVATIAARRPLTGAPTALPVLAEADGPRQPWLQVALPGRPNGRTAWIRKRVTRAKATSWHLVIDLSTRQVLAYDKGVLVRSAPAVIGKPSTPTPTGAFFVEELVALAPGAAGGPFALALSARSTVLQEFAGGPGQIGVHGLANIGGTPGTAVSHGCVRVDGPMTRWLVNHVRTGTPVTIRATST